jgi:hypothetical protein
VQIVISDRCLRDEFRSADDLVKWARVLGSGIIKVIRDIPEHVTPSTRGKDGQLSPKLAKVLLLLVSTADDQM